MTHHNRFLSFADKLLSSQAKSPPPCEIRYIDGRKWAITWMDNKTLNYWPWVVAKACEEFECEPADVTCKDWTTDSENYAGIDAGHDKIAVKGKVVGYCV